MTYKEAFDLLMEEHRQDREWSQKSWAAKEILGQLVERSTAKRKHKYQGYRCVCGEEVAKNQRYCEYCGQELLDWDEK